MIYYVIPQILFKIKQIYQIYDKQNYIYTVAVSHYIGSRPKLICLKI